MDMAGWDFEARSRRDRRRDRPVLLGAVPARDQKPLHEIALACGFRDYTFFSRKFRERFGCTPSAYAESN